MCPMRGMGAKPRLLVWDHIYFTLTFSNQSGNTDGELYREAVPQAPSLGRFDVLLLSFEVEKCGLCFLLVGEKYGVIDKKLACVHVLGKERKRGSA